MNEYEQALTRIIELEDKMDNQDLTMERRLKAKDRLIAELLEALETLSVVADTPYPIDKKWLSHFVAEAIHKAKEK